MTPEQFRTEGKKVIDWIADYYENVEKYPVLSQVKPGEIIEKLPLSPPQKGESLDRMMDDIDKIISTIENCTAQLKHKYIQDKWQITLNMAIEVYAKEMEVIPKI